MLRRRNTRNKPVQAQSTIEYMVLFATVVSLVLVGFHVYFPRVYDASNVYYNKVGAGILGKPSRCGDNVCEVGLEDEKNCCHDCTGPGAGPGSCTF